MAGELGPLPRTRMHDSDALPVELGRCPHYRGGPLHVDDEDGLELAAGTFVLDIDNQNAYGQEVCLPPGNYTLHLDQVGFVGGQLYYGMTTSMVNNGKCRNRMCKARR